MPETTVEIVATEKFTVRTTYRVTGENLTVEEAMQQVRSGQVAYDSKEVLEGGEEFVEFGDVTVLSDEPGSYGELIQWLRTGLDGSPYVRIGDLAGVCRDIDVEERDGHVYVRDHESGNTVRAGVSEQYGFIYCGTWKPVDVEN